MAEYLPEGRIYPCFDNQAAISSPKGMEKAMEDGRTLEAIAFMYDNQKNLFVRLHGCRGCIPFEEVSDEPLIKDVAVIARIGKPVSFKVTGLATDDGRTFILSRKAVMSEYRNGRYSSLAPGDVIDGTVTHIDRFGCFVDVGAGINVLLPTDNICYSHIPSPDAVFRCGDKIKCIVKARDGENRLQLTHKELLGTFKENSALFSQFATTIGVVRSVMPYGIFIELAPNLTGLAEYRPGIEPGTSVCVSIKSIIPEKLKIKLSIIDVLGDSHEPPELKYYIPSDHIESFTYSPWGCEKTIETFFI